MPALDFADLTPDHLEELRQFAVVPFAGILQASPQQIVARWKDEIVQALSSESVIAIRAESGAKACGLAVCLRLPWESGLLGKSMWSIRHIGVDAGPAERTSVACGLIAEIVRRAKAQAVDFLLCKTPGTDPAIIHALELNGFLLMDTVLDCVFGCRNPSTQAKEQPVPPGIVIRLATAADADALAKTARDSFAEHFGRFHADPRIGRAAATRIYEEWIRSCVSGWADWVFVATNEENIAGYSAWKKISALDDKHALRLAHYNIGCVHPAFFGRGLFTALTRAGMNLLCASADWIEGPTHFENIPVQRGYLRLGWQIEGAQHSFHKWLTS
jgi:hypothetical protein